MMRSVSFVFRLILQPRLISFRGQVADRRVLITKAEQKQHRHLSIRLHFKRPGREERWESFMDDGPAYKLIYLARRAKTVSRADWPRTWRSHAIFASQFPVIENGLKWLRYCNRIDEPAVGGKPAGLPPLTAEHDGVAVAGSGTLEGISGGGIPPDLQAKIDEDERRVFDMLTPNFTFFATETVLKDGRLGNAALFHFLPRAEGLTRAQFSARYQGEYAERARQVLGSVAGLTRSSLNHPVNDPLPFFPFDGISETWFETAEHASGALQAGSFDWMAGDLASFCDLDRSVLMPTSVCHRWSDPWPNLNTWVGTHRERWRTSR